MNDPMPVGWSWGCACGWVTGRHAGLLAVEQLREGHLRWHRARRELREREAARA